MKTCLWMTGKVEAAVWCSVTGAGERLSVLPFWADLIDEFKEAAQELVVEFVRTILEKHTEKHEERVRFEHVVASTRQRMEQLSIDIIGVFSKKKKALFRDLSSLDAEDALHRLTSLEETVNEMQSDLMEVGAVSLPARDRIRWSCTRPRRRSSSCSSLSATTASCVRASSKRCRHSERPTMWMWA